MRSDMAKVIVERPRFGHRDRHDAKGYHRRRQRIDRDEQPKRESMYALKGNSKRLNEHLAPLRRYLRSQVGRLWDDVFAEICAHIRLDSAVQSHVRDHLDDFVETHVMVIDGRVCHGRGWSVGRELSGSPHGRFYVCPRTGILREVKYVKYQWAALEVDPGERVSVDATREYRLMDEVWYEIILRPRVRANFADRDIVLDKPVAELSSRYARAFYGHDVYAAGRRQLNKREIRRLGLRRVLKVRWWRQASLTM